MKKSLCIVAFLVSVPFLQEVRSEQYIKLCSFNIAELGTSTPNKDHRAIATMLHGCDLIVVQEVQDKDGGGAAHIAAITDSLNNSAHPDSLYTWFVIPSAGRGFPGNEGYGYIFRSPVRLDSLYQPTYGLKTTTVSYGRTPGWAFFRAGNFDFILATVHLHWSNLDTRAAEVADLIAWLKEFSGRTDTQERDLIIAGDFNRFGNYSNTAINNRQTAFHQLLDDPTLNLKYRLPFCEFLPTMDTKEAPNDSGSTTVADNNMLYDQIVISQGAFNEFGPASGSLGNNIRIVAFDYWPQFATMTPDSIKDYVSDHRPIWASFRIDLDDDDGFGGDSGGSGSGQQFKKGDINQDAKVDVFDLLDLLKILSGR